MILALMHSPPSKIGNNWANECPCFNRSCCGPLGQHEHSKFYHETNSTAADRLNRSCDDIAAQPMHILRQAYVTSSNQRIG